MPVGANLDPISGVLTWTPNLTQAGTYSGIVLSAGDGYLSDSATIAITVTPVSQAPVFVPLPPQSGREGTPTQFTVSAADPDGDTLTYSVISGLPSGANFTDASGQFQWTPAYGQAGNYTVVFGATDPGGPDRQLCSCRSTSPSSIARPCWRSPTTRPSSASRSHSSSSAATRT